MSNYNKSNYKPFGTRVLIKVKEEPKELKSEGGIILATETGYGEHGDSSWERRQLAVVVGQIVECGSKAFYDQGDDAPKEGDYVIFKKYAGVHIEGDDEQAYRSVVDMDIHTITQSNKDVVTIG